MTVSSQAFLNANEASNPALSYGADGILGLAFKQESTIWTLLERQESNGNPFLYNVFAQNTDSPNFISFSLESVSDNSDDAGNFTICECFFSIFVQCGY